MKVILNHSTPFSLAHGGVTNIVQRTRDVLDSSGIEVDHLRWWDESQKGDVLLQFCRPPISLVRFAKAAGYRVAVEHVMTGLVSRPASKRFVQKKIIRFARRYLPQIVADLFSWESFATVDMNFFPSEWDQYVAADMFSVPSEKSCILPYGVNEAFLLSKPTGRKDYLICTATITPRKRVLEVARACHEAKVPLKIVGKAYAQSDEYFDLFAEIEKNSPFVSHVPHVSDQNALASLYRGARGFVLLSAMETISQSAIEAAACETPLLLSDMDWAHRSFGSNAQYCPVTKNLAVTAQHIRTFYDDAPGLKPSWRPPSWQEARKNLPEVLKALMSKESAFRLAGKHV